MDKQPQSFLTTPLAILLGCLVISVAILMHGGVIRVGGLAPAAQPQAAAQPAAGGAAPAAKSQTEIIDSLKQQAQQLGLNTGDFNSCLDGGSKAAAVQADLDDGVAAGVTGTPAFFINGRLISGAVPFEQLKQVIDEELNGTAPATATRVTVEAGDLPISGDQNAKVTLIEFSDYECPFCERHFTQTEPQLKSEYIDKGLVKFYYRDFPLSQIHPGAQKAAEAARCAGDQGKYWEYHDLLFQNQANIF